MTELPSIEEIASLLRELASRANGYWEEFAENVEFVKLSLVQPFLRLMGWNPEDPEDVKPMYVSGLAVFDYALMGDEGDTPVSMVSVSKLGFLEAVRGRLVDLAVGCSRSGVSYLVCTDGVEWAVYSVDDLDSPYPLLESAQG
jgi:predicted type IV restriction endonuclease